MRAARGAEGSRRCTAQGVHGHDVDKDFLAEVEKPNSRSRRCRATSIASLVSDIYKTTPPAVAEKAQAMLKVAMQSVVPAKAGRHKSLRRADLAEDIGEFSATCFRSSGLARATSGKSLSRS